MRARIAVLPGDGVGPEVTAEAARALKAIAARFGHDFELVEAPVGAAAMEAGQEPLPPATLALARGERPEPRLGDFRVVYDVPPAEIRAALPELRPMPFSLEPQGSRIIFIE